MPGHVKRGGSGDPDPDPSPFLLVSSTEKQRDLAKVIEPNHLCSETRPLTSVSMLLADIK